MPYGGYDVSDLRVSAAWQSGGGRENDYGAILLPYPGHAWGLGPWIQDDAKLQNIEVTNAGYPGDKAPYGFQWQDSGRLTGVHPKMLDYMNDTYGGESGSPVLHNYSGSWWSAGIHGYGGCPNRPVRLTWPVYNDLANWAAG